MTPSELANAARCFNSCLSGELLGSVYTMLVAQWAGGGTPPVPVEELWIEQAVDGGQFFLDFTYSLGQHIQMVGGPRTISAVSMNLELSVGLITVRVSSGINGTGTLYAAQTQVVAGARDWYKFSFGSPPVIPGDFFITITTAVQTYVGYVNAKVYASPPYSYTINAVQQNDKDLQFRIYDLV